MGGRIRRHLLRSAGRHDLAAGVASLRPEVDHPVRRLDDVEVVLDHDDGVPSVDETVQNVEQTLHVGEVQTRRRLVDRGNTVLVIEHNLDVIKTADWIIDLGPEGGTRGGSIVAAGTPEEVAQVGASYTGQFLAPALGRRGRRTEAAE